VECLRVYHVAGGLMGGGDGRRREMSSCLPTCGSLWSQLNGWSWATLGAETDCRLHSGDLRLSLSSPGNSCQWRRSHGGKEQSRLYAVYGFLQPSDLELTCLY